MLERKNAEGENRPDTVEIKTAIAEFSKTLDAFMKKTDTEISEVRKGGADAVTKAEIKGLADALAEQKKLVEALRLENNRPVITSSDGTKTALTEDQVLHRKHFHQFFRKGVEVPELRELEAKTLSVGSDPDGGYTVPVQMEAAIDRVVTELSPIRSLCRVVPVSTASYKKRVGMGGASSGWVAEQGGRPNTNTPQMELLEFPVMELYANPSATQSLLDDSAIDIETWLAEEVALEFAVQEASAFINGNGATRPRGMLQYTTIEEDSWSWGKVGYRVTGVSGDWADSTSDPGAEVNNIVDLVYALKPAFRANAAFLTNRKTVSELMKLRDADGRQLWSSGLAVGQPDRLMGYPVRECEDMPDIAANSFSMAFGDYRRGYTIVDRIGTRVLRDPFSAKPYVQFYTTKRVGGGISHFDAIKLLKFGTS